MGRKTVEITTLHNNSIEDLMKLRNNSKSKYTANILTIIIMKYKGTSNKLISEATGFSNTTIVKHIHQWNRYGLKTTVDNRKCHTDPKLSPDIVDDIIFVVTHKNPTDYEFIGHTWTCALLVDYIYQNYSIKVSIPVVWKLLKKNNLSYKRAMPKPTKANEQEQATFKKNLRNNRYFRIFN